MNVVELASIPMDKEAGWAADAGRALWRYARRPLLGAERAAVGAEKQMGQMSAKAEQGVANQVTRSGMSRDTHNTILNKWVGNAKDSLGNPIAAGTTYNPMAAGAVTGTLVGGYGGYQDAMQSGQMSDIFRGAAKGAVVGGALGWGGGRALKHFQKGGKTHKELYESYQKAAPQSVTSQVAPKNELMSTFKQFEQGTGKFKNTGEFVGTRAERIAAQKARDLKASFSGFAQDADYLAKVQKSIDRVKATDMGAFAPTVGGAALGAVTAGEGNRLQGAALGGLTGFAGVKGLNRLSRSPARQKALNKLVSRRNEVMATHGKGSLSQQAKYMGERAKSILGERGQFNTLGERLRFGKTTGFGTFAGRGLETVGARARQGGLLGKGGLIRGGIAWDPRIKMNIDMARHAAGQGQYAQALGYGTNAAVGTGVQGLKFGLMGAMPTMGVYDAVTADDPTQSAGRRFMGAMGRSIGGTALFPLGAATYAASFVPGYESLSVGEQLGRGLEYATDKITGTSPTAAQRSTYGEGGRFGGGGYTGGRQSRLAAQSAAVNPGMERYLAGYQRPVQAPPR